MITNLNTQVVSSGVREVSPDESPATTNNGGVSTAPAVQSSSRGADAAVRSIQPAKQSKYSDTQTQ
jgi:hypothetical protein